MVTSEKLLARLQAMGLELPEGARLVRANASRSARANGAWVWRAEGTTGWVALPTWYTSDQGGIGSQWSMTELLRRPTLGLTCNDYGEISVDPCAAGYQSAYVVVEGQGPGQFTRSWWKPTVVVEQGA